MRAANNHYPVNNHCPPTTCLNPAPQPHHLPPTLPADHMPRRVLHSYTLYTQHRSRPRPCLPDPSIRPRAARPSTPLHARPALHAHPPGPSAWPFRARPPPEPLHPPPTTPPPDAALHHHHHHPPPPPTPAAPRPAPALFGTPPSDQPSRRRDNSSLCSSV